jgi:molybdenum cofactor cytidylyltransferase
MGSAKQLLPWGNTTVLGQTLHNLQQSAVGDILVVTGYKAKAVAAIAAAHAIPVVHNPDYDRGEMLSSLQVAVRQLPAGCAAALAVLADQPMVGPEIINQLLRAFAEGGHNLIAPTYRGQRGNPVLIGRRYFDELLALPIGAAPRDLLRRHQAELRLVAVDSDAILQDLDTPEAYERWRP